jgi:hypothetical protein
MRIRAVWDAGIRFAHLPALFALGFQGVNGLIQISGFFALEGQPYLAFSEAFVVGNVIGIFLLMNYENIILAGNFTRSIRQYAAAAWVVGVVAAAIAVFQGSASPGAISFAAWTICIRVALAWANFNRPKPAALVIWVVLVGLAVLFGTPSQVILTCLLFLPLAASGLFFGEIAADEGFGPRLLHSARAFLKYLPHTICGIALAYLDRFLALSSVPDDLAELYLRTVQVCSWAAFVAFPVVFHLRSSMLKAGVLTPRKALSILGAETVTMVLAVSSILGVLWSLGRGNDTAWIPLAMVLAAIIFSQYYQIVSTLNFVLERFGTINRITLTSAASAAAVGLIGVWLYPRAETLALMLLTGWLLQSILTTRALFGSGNRASGNGTGTLPPR